MTIGKRLALGFGVLMVLAAVQGFWGLSYMKVLNVRMDQVYTRNLLAIKGLSGMQAGLHRMRVDAMSHVLSRRGDEMAALAQEIRQQRRQIEEVLGQYRTHTHAAVEQKLIDRYESHFNSYADSIVLDILPVSTAGDKAEAMAMIQRRMVTRFNKAYGYLNDLIDYHTHIARTDYEYAMADYRTVSSRVLGLLVTLVVIGFAVSAWVTRSITRPIKAAVDMANRVATGDLTGDMEITARDETGELLRALTKMSRDLTRIVRQARLASVSIMDTARGIETGNLDLSQRTGEQSASLEETASSMEEITATVRRNADNAAEVNAAAQGSRERAQEGAARMGEVVKTIARIQGSARQITGVIGVIDEIAFQTNLLALNAAVEAARAGRNGLGFGVVAGEVRALAQRSATAAREIKGLIAGSEATVRDGGRLVGEARTSMDGIVEQVERVGTLIREIAHASAEQGHSIEHIDIAITQLGDTTQKNAALAEETTAATSVLMEHAEHLVRVVQTFKIADEPASDDAMRPDVPARSAVTEPRAGTRATVPHARVGGRASSPASTGGFMVSSPTAITGEKS
ncbi:MAG TPA: methyl-accepting chemotaxis protein [Acidiferrobacterales bacterium]